MHISALPIYSILFVVYALFGAPLLLQAFASTMENGRRNSSLSIILFAAMALGIAGIRWKNLAISARPKSAAQPSRRQTVFLFSVWILHVTICIMLAMTALAGFGNAATDNSVWQGVTITAIVLIEFFVLYWIFAVHPHNQPRRNCTEQIADFCLFIFGCVVYTCYWDALGVQRLNDYTWIVFFCEIFASAVMFMIVYLPIKLPELMEEYHAGETTGRRARMTGMLAMGLAVAILPPVKNTLMEGGRYTNLAKALAEPAKAQKIYLSEQKLTTLPPEIGTLRHARILRLTGNKLTILPPELAQMTNLEELRIGNNQVQTIPPEIGLLTNLTLLEAFNNYISHVPETIGNAQQLQEINLRWNSLTNLPTALNQLKGLKKMRLSGNPLPPDEIARLRELLPHCKIEF